MTRVQLLLALRLLRRVHPTARLLMRMRRESRRLRAQLAARDAWIEQQQEVIDGLTRRLRAHESAKPLQERGEHERR